MMCECLLKPPRGHAAQTFHATKSVCMQDRYGAAGAGACVVNHAMIATGRVRQSRRDGRDLAGNPFVFQGAKRDSRLKGAVAAQGKRGARVLSDRQCGNPS
jgi:hypothetical protein